MKYVLGVDPGVISGWAFVGSNGPILWGQCGKKGAGCTGADVRIVLNECHTERFVLAIEGQFLPDESGKSIVKGRGKESAKDRHKAVSSLKTALYAGMWIGICQEHGIDVFKHEDKRGRRELTIPPVTWRSKVWGGRWTNEQAKKHAVEMANAVWNITVLKTHHHEAEAMWIAEYALRELRQKQLQAAMWL